MLESKKILELNVFKRRINENSQLQLKEFDRYLNKNPFTSKLPAKLQFHNIKNLQKIDTHPNYRHSEPIYITDTLKKLGLDWRLRQFYEEICSIKPSLQEKIAWPSFLQDRHVVLSGQNFPGLVMSYALPLLQHIILNKNGKNLCRSPMAIVISFNNATSRWIYFKIKHIANHCGINGAHLNSETFSRTKTSVLESEGDFLVINMNSLIHQVCENKVDLNNCSLLIFENASILTMNPVGLAMIRRLINHTVYTRKIILFEDSIANNTKAIDYLHQSLENPLIINSQKTDTSLIKNVKKQSVLYTDQIKGIKQLKFILEKENKQTLIYCIDKTSLIVIQDMLKYKDNVSITTNKARHNINVFNDFVKKHVKLNKKTILITTTRMFPAKFIKTPENHTLNLEIERVIFFGCPMNFYDYCAYGSMAKELITIAMTNMKSIEMSQHLEQLPKIEL